MGRRSVFLPIIPFVLLIASLSAESMAEPSQNNTYTIVKGDTLWSVARQYYGDPNKFTLILEYNPEVKKTHELRPGQVIFLGPRPNDTPEKTSPAEPAATPESADSTEPAKPAEPPAPPAPDVRQRPFEWTKYYDASAEVYRISVSDKNGTFFTHKLPIAANDYYDNELASRIRKNDPDIMSQIDKMGDVSFVDVNFDGFEDLVIEKGTFGPLNIRFRDIILWDESQQNFVPQQSADLIIIGNPPVWNEAKKDFIQPEFFDLLSSGNVSLYDSERKILLTKQTDKTKWEYYKYIINQDGQWIRHSKVREDCGRTTTIGQFYKMREEELDKIPYSCRYEIYNYSVKHEVYGNTNKDDNDYAERIEYSALSQEWKKYIQGTDHPDKLAVLMDPKDMEKAKAYKRSHTLHFDSQEELEKWKRENNALDQDEMRRMWGF